MCFHLLGVVHALWLGLFVSNHTFRIFSDFSSLARPTHCTNFLSWSHPYVTTHRPRDASSYFSICGHGEKHKIFPASGMITSNFFATYRTALWDILNPVGG